MSGPLPDAEARRFISIKGLAPLAMAYASQPRDPLNFHAPRWRERLRATEAEVIETLREGGVTIAIGDNGAVRVSFAGISTSSRLGLRKALQNWKAKAQGKRVDGFYRPLPTRRTSK